MVQPAEQSFSFQQIGEVGQGHTMLVYNVQAPLGGFQRRSELEKSMRDWFDTGGLQTNKCVLCGPSGIGKSTLGDTSTVARQRFAECCIR